MEGTGKSEAQKEVGNKSSLHVEVGNKSELFITCVITT